MLNPDGVNWCSEEDPAAVTKHRRCVAPMTPLLDVNRDRCRVCVHGVGGSMSTTLVQPRALRHSVGDESLPEQRKASRQGSRQTRRRADTIRVVGHVRLTMTPRGLAAMLSSVRPGRPTPRSRRVPQAPSLRALQPPADPGHQNRADLPLSPADRSSPPSHRQLLGLTCAGTPNGAAPQPNEPCLVRFRFSGRPRSERPTAPPARPSWLPPHGTVTTRPLPVALDLPARQRRLSSYRVKDAWQQPLPVIFSQVSTVDEVVMT